jgi:hypothetical protein
MGISGRGDGTAGPALHADVLAGFNDEQRAAASYGGGAGQCREPAESLQRAPVMDGL